MKYPKILPLPSCHDYFPPSTRDNRNIRQPTFAHQIKNKLPLTFEKDAQPEVKGQTLITCHLDGCLFSAGKKYDLIVVLIIEIK
jgi:hypothetical protein